MLDYSLEYLFSYHLRLNPLEVGGAVPDGIRASLCMTDGTVTGKKIHGKLKPISGNWFTVRPDGVAITDVRGTIETNDRALIYLSYTGVMDLGEDGYRKFLEGKLPPIAKIRNAPRFQTAHPKYDWINRVQCISEAEVDFTKFEADYDVYALR
jgi:Protein of unknown function (DUF3237)